MSDTKNGWTEWGHHVLSNQAEFKAELGELRAEVVELRVEVGRVSALLTEGRSDAKDALRQTQCNKVKIGALTVRTGLVAALVSLAGTGLGALFVYVISRM